MNKVILMGRLAREPEVRYLGEQQSYRWRKVELEAEDGEWKMD